MKPWKSVSEPCRPTAACGFNGATAMKPWKRQYDDAASGIALVMLQWGHGDEAVEEDRVGADRAGPEAASMGPRR